MSRESRVRDLLRTVPLIDGHNDFPWQLWAKADRDFAKADIRKRQDAFHTDIPRLLEGGVGAQFWSVYVPCNVTGDTAVRTALEQIDVVYRMLARYPDVFELAQTAGGVERIHGAGKIASLIGIEGGHCIHESLAALRMFRRLGARYMTLTHNDNTAWADSATDEPAHGGLTDFGRDVVREMNRIGMIVDLSHVSPDTMRDAIDVGTAPVLFTHSSARALCDHARNVPDDVLVRVRDNGGVVMVTFVPSFVSEHVRCWLTERTAVGRPHEDPEQRSVAVREWEERNPRPRAALADVADHIDHIRDVAGIEHVGIGGDFDGIETVPDGLEDVSKYHVLIGELLDRGYSDEDVAKIAGSNVLRVLRDVDAAASAVLEP